MSNNVEVADALKKELPPRLSTKPLLSHIVLQNCFITQYLLSSSKWRSIGFHPHGPPVPQACRSASISAGPHLRLLYELAARVKDSTDILTILNRQFPSAFPQTYSSRSVSVAGAGVKCKERTCKTKQMKTQRCSQTELLSGV